MMGKKMGMRRILACALAAALVLGGMATSLAAPTVAEAYPSGATRPIQDRSSLAAGKKYQPVVLAGGKDYVFAGSVDVQYYEVEGGTADRPTRLYFSSSSLGGPLTDKRDNHNPLFVFKGGYVELIGDNGTATEVRCNGNTFMSDNENTSISTAPDKPNTGKKLNLTVRDLKLVTNTGVNDRSQRAIMLYGTMGGGETATFTNVNVSGWNCNRNIPTGFMNETGYYVASPAPVTIRGCHAAVNATFNGCTFNNNTDDCTGALSVVGRDKRPNVTLNNCTFTDNHQGLNVCEEEKVETGHVHSGNIVVKNADVTLNGCSIRSTPETGSISWNGPCVYPTTTSLSDKGVFDMHMTSAIAVAKDASCTINDTTIEDLYVSPYYDEYRHKLSDYDPLRSTVYALGSVTLAGNTKVTSTAAKGIDVSDCGQNAKVDIDGSFTGDVVLSVDDDKFDSEKNKKDYYFEYVNAGTSALSQEDLASRLKLTNDDLTFEVADGRYKVVHRKHEHVWKYSKNQDGYSIAAKCEGQYEASHCNFKGTGATSITEDTISLMSSTKGDLNFTYNGKPREVTLTSARPSDETNAVAQGKVKVTGARFYRRVDANDATGFEMEGSVPTDAGYYRVVATVSIEGQEDVTLERLFQIKPASLAEKDSDRKALCKIEVVGYDRLRDGVKFRGDTFNGVPSYKWTGEEIKPRIKVTYKLDGEWIELREGVDFERFEWGESVSEKDLGSYRSQAWGKGNFAYGQFFYWTIYGTQFKNVQATGFEGPYDGKAHSPSVTVDNDPSEMENFQVEYRASGDEMWSGHIPSYTNVTRDIYGNPEAKTIEYKITAADFVPVEGTVTIKITPADQDAPEAIKTTAPSGHGLTDGSITGVDETCEWAAEGTDGYQVLAKGQTTLKGLAAGKYSVRRKADRNHNASDTVTVEIKDGPKKADGKGWKHDDAEHWNTCTCGKEDVDRAAHDFEWVEDQAATADKPGKKHQRCKTCGYEREGVEIPAFGITGYEDAFDGKNHGVTVNTETVKSIKFREKGAGKWSDESPVICEAGSKTVEFQATLASGDACEGEVELKVTPRAVTVKPKDATKVYGRDDPDYAVETVEGELVKGWPLSKVKISRGKGENVGTYEMSMTLAKEDNPNYEVTVQPGTFIITARTLGVACDIGTYVYNGEPQGPEPVLSNVVKGDEGKISLKTEGATAVDAGGYTLKMTGIEGDPEVVANYVLPDRSLQYNYRIQKASQKQPEVTAVAETIRGKHDGKIEGAHGGIAYRVWGTDDEPMVSEDGKIEGLAPGNYQVWYVETANYDASPSTTVKVDLGRFLSVRLPKDNDAYSIDLRRPVSLPWHGELEIPVTISDGYYAGDDFAVKANGVALERNERGEFVLRGIEDDVTITVEGVAKHEAVNDTWLSDENGHWHECTCGDVIDKAEHTFEWVVDQKPTATEPGSKHQECTVCGFAKPAVEIPAASVGGYSGDYDGQWHGPDTTSVPDGLMVSYSYDNGKSWTTGEPGRKDVGTEEFIYEMTIDGAVVEGKAAIEIAPRPITLKATDASKIYGETDPQLGYTVVSENQVVAGESLDGITVTREKGDTVKDGGYAITVAQEKGANSNYAITLEPGVFSITQRPLKVAWGTTDFVFDGKAHAPTATLGNVLKGDEVEATVEGAQTEVNRAGEPYTATVTGLTGKSAGNYALPAEGLSQTFTIKNAPQDAPVVQAEAETVSGKRDGKITGVDATMEWRAKDATSYQSVSGDVKELTGLAPGTYLVRYQAKANHDASPDTEVTVAAGHKLAVTLPTQQVGYTLTATASELDWHGSATLTMSIDSQYFAGKDYAVKVNGKKVELSANGTYVIKDVETNVNVTVDGLLKHEPDGTGWKSDGADHWHVCRCGDVIDKAAHDFAWVTDTPATVEAGGTRHQECTVCGARGKDGKIAILAPEIVDGKDQTLVKAPEVPVNSDLTVRSNAPLSLFKRVLVDGKEVAATHYTLKEGSTIVTLKAAYLATLSTGEHRLSIESESGTAETTFTIAEQQKSADSNGGTATGGNGGTAKPSASKGDTKKGAGTKTATGKSAKATMPSVGDSALAMVAAVLTAGIASIVAALVVRRKS